MAKYILIFIIALACNGPKDTKHTPVSTNNQKMQNYFPFELASHDNQFSVIVNLESEQTYPKYYTFFEKHGYEGNGYCWEGHITQILEVLDKDLLHHIEFDPEAGGFYAYIDSEENQLKFVQLLSPIFSDLNKLEEWVKKADRSRIHD